MQEKLDEPLELIEEITSDDDIAIEGGAQCADAEKLEGISDADSSADIADEVRIVSVGTAKSVRTDRQTVALHQVALHATIKPHPNPSAIFALGSTCGTVVWFLILWLLGQSSAFMGFYVAMFFMVTALLVCMFFAHFKFFALTELTLGTLKPVVHVLDFMTLFECRHEASLHALLGELYRDIGRHSEALEHGIKSARIAGPTASLKYTTGSQIGICEDLWALMKDDLCESKARGYLQLLRDGRADKESAVDTDSFVRGILNLASVLQKRNKFDEALALYQEAQLVFDLGLFKETWRQAGVQSLIYTHRAEAELAEGKLVECRKSLGATFDTIDGVVFSSLSKVILKCRTVAALSVLIDLELLQGNVEAAKEQHKKQAILEPMKLTVDRASLKWHRQLAEIREREFDLEGADEIYRKIVTSLRAHGHRLDRDVIETEKSYQEFLQRTGQYNDAQLIGSCVAQDYATLSAFTSSSIDACTISKHKFQWHVESKQRINRLLMYISVFAALSAGCALLAQAETTHVISFGLILLMLFVPCAILDRHRLKKFSIEKLAELDSHEILFEVEFRSLYSTTLRIKDSTNENLKGVRVVIENDCFVPRNLWKGEARGRLHFAVGSQAAVIDSMHYYAFCKLPKKAVSKVKSTSQ